MVKAIGQELLKRKEYIKEPVNTVYFGGGTPSLLSPDQLKELLEIVDDSFEVASQPEITMEANPEDLTQAYAHAIVELGFNRLSIGIQTFDNKKLKWMNRIHSAEESFYAVNNAREAGFTNISLDLIYAIPNRDLKAWEEDLIQITALNPEHISLYGLTIEEHTVFGKWEKQNSFFQVPEELAAEQYLLAIDLLKKKGYIQYEVSNFGKAGFHSRHNHAYWAGVTYLGVGPGAHSFNGESRSFNIRNNAKYIRAIQEGIPFSETEALSKTQQINEQILTQLRTKKGLNLYALNKKSGRDIGKDHQSFINEMKSLGLIELDEGHLRLLPKGFLVADEIALKFFLTE